jgi:hypothetical protein
MHVDFDMGRYKNPGVTDFPAGKEPLSAIRMARPQGAWMLAFRPAEGGRARWLLMFAALLTR